MSVCMLSLAFAIRYSSMPSKKPSKWRASRLSISNGCKSDIAKMSAVQSPLFEPVHWQGASFEILDEIQVPEKIEYIQVTEVTQAIDAVREMKTRAYGQVLTFLYSAALVAQQYQGKDPTPLRERLAQLTQQFCDVRPTFDFRGLGGYVEEFFGNLPANGAVGQVIAHRARVRRANHPGAERPRQTRCFRVAQSGARIDPLQHQRRTGCCGALLSGDG